MHLTQFLEKYSERFDFDIFTAAMACYADPVLNTLDPEQKFFSKRYYRDSCPEWHNYAKDLEVCLAGSDYYQSMSRIVLVDNSTTNKWLLLMEPTKWRSSGFRTVRTRREASFDGPGGSNTGVLLYIQY